MNAREQKITKKGPVSHEMDLKCTKKINKKFEKIGGKNWEKLEKKIGKNWTFDG